MEKLIKIYDNIINPKLVDSVLEKTPDIQYYYNDYSTRVDNNIYTPTFANIILSPNKKINDTSFYFLQVLYDFCFKIGFEIEDIFLGRLYLQIPSISSKVHPAHVDLPFPHFVCLYYINDSDGDTIFYEDDQKTEIKRITPKKGRVAFFDGSIFHSASSPTSKDRLILNFSFNGKIL